ncbi:MAG: DUF4278 domain-containing protein [Fischerella sp.]|jgi:hypothetical protein|uniref:DUF4278 domain-containing protein n=1 Tax=Fischerella sp. TaxID=1191 RepID=UPI0017A8DA60|nr:DUF4278 domain-containing protein [Fischerella sp.]NWF58857.1 DUF4278 domain-containing protein [Fischerella sp.]
MQLTYRAANYEYNPYNTCITEGNRTGIYRGVKTRFHLPKVVRQHQSPRLLKYRGITYINWR